MVHKAILASALLALTGCVGEAEDTSQRPNVVLIVADDLGWKDVGFNGAEHYATPNLDRLASRSQVFSQAYSNAPNCAPTRASLLTGLYTPRHGIYTVASSERGKSEHRRLIPTENTTVLDTAIVTISELLQEAGYHTAHAGKWHLGEGEHTGPTGRGFDINIAGNRRGHPPSYFSPYRNDFLADGEDGEHLTDRITSEAAAFIRSDHGSRPFFLYLPFYAVHTPIQPRPDLEARFTGQIGTGIEDFSKYAGLLAGMDEGVGRIMAALEAIDAMDNTLVIFVSDNGGHGAYTDQAPLRGSKGMLYEGGIRVPMTIRWPDERWTGTSAIPVITSDLFPTVASMASIEHDRVDGLDIADLVSGKSSRDHLFWHFPAYLEAYRGMTGPWRITPSGAILEGNWKLLEFFETGNVELYDLASDIGEQSNLADAEPERANRMLGLLNQWRSELDAPVPVEPNPGFQ